MNQVTISLPDAVKNCLKRYCSCKGRASRGEFWWYSFFVVIVIFSIMTIVSRNTSLEITASVFGLLALFWGVPLWSVAIRRLHDTGRSGWWMLAMPLLFVFFCLPSEKKVNRFGLIPCLRGTEAQLLKYSADTMDSFDRHGE